MKKVYIVPVVEICSVQTRLMSWDLNVSGSHGQTAPKRRQTPVF